MSTFYICRHGETENNRANRLSGWIDTPLTKQGFRNVQSTASKLKNIQFDSVYSSDLGRAFITAYLLTKSQGYSSGIHLEKDLREVNYGIYANATIDDVVNKVPELLFSTDFVPKNGESLAQMQLRVLACVKRISMDNPEKTILLASHDGPINALLAYFTGVDLGKLMEKRINPHDFAGKFIVTNGKIVSFSE